MATIKETHKHATYSRQAIAHQREISYQISDDSLDSLLLNSPRLFLKNHQESRPET